MPIDLLRRRGDVTVNCRTVWSGRNGKLNATAFGACFAVRPPVSSRARVRARLETGGRRREETVSQNRTRTRGLPRGAVSVVRRTALAQDPMHSSGDVGLEQRRASRALHALELGLALAGRDQDASD